jgi:prenylcysteine oxidase/farnesylcysteine lyase
MNPSAKALIIFLSLSGTSSAFQFPFKLPWGQTESPKSITTPEVQLSVNGTQPLRIAIVGAGAGGSSAAFWLAKAKERFGYDYEVDVYEKSNYIGGSECHR